MKQDNLLPFNKLEIVRKQDGAIDHKSQKEREKVTKVQRIEVEEERGKRRNKMRPGEEIQCSSSRHDNENHSNISSDSGKQVNENVSNGRKKKTKLTKIVIDIIYSPDVYISRYKLNTEQVYVSQGEISKKALFLIYRKEVMRQFGEKEGDIQLGEKKRFNQILTTLDMIKFIKIENKGVMLIKDYRQKIKNQYKEQLKNKPQKVQQKRKIFHHFSQKKDLIEKNIELKQNQRNSKDSEKLMMPFQILIYPSENGIVFSNDKNDKREEKELIVKGHFDIYDATDFLKYIHPKKMESEYGSYID